MRSDWLLPLVLLASYGCGGTGSAATREYTLHLRALDSNETSTDKYEFVAEEPIDIQVGDRVTFEMLNAGQLAHNFRVTDARSSTLGFADIVAPGKSLQVVVTFEQPGLYRLACDFDDHLTKHDMQAIIEVTL